MELDDEDGLFKVWFGGLILVKNRSRVDIVAAVLEASKRGVNKTNIMYRANLSFSLLEKYLNAVLRAGFVRVEGSSYFLTERGREFLERYNRFREHYVGIQKLSESLACEQEKLLLMFENSG